jgi:hypothetical protein
MVMSFLGFTRAGPVGSPVETTATTGTHRPDRCARFDPDPAARRSVADRVTFEVPATGRLLGGRYDVVYLVPAPPRRTTVS